jgi:hypothetical protein
VGNEIVVLSDDQQDKSQRPRRTIVPTRRVLEALDANTLTNYNGYTMDTTEG